MSDSFSERTGTGHVLGELGLGLELIDDQLHGTAEVSPFMCVPGTNTLRTSILAIWVDVLTGMLCIDIFGGRVPVTLDLSVDVVRPVQSYGRIDAVSRKVKVGRSVAVVDVEFRAEGSDECFAIGSASFMATPDASFTLPSRAESVAEFGRRGAELTEPFAERVGSERLGPGVACLSRRSDGLNASNSINGGLLALVVEEAALSGAPSGTTLSSMALRYLRPARVGPVIGRTTSYGEAARVEVRDAGADDRLAVLAVTKVVRGETANVLGAALS